MNRRGFLSFLGIGAAAIALDPERALWVPGKKLISIASPEVQDRLRLASLAITQQQQFIIQAFRAEIFGDLQAFYRDLQSTPASGMAGLYARGAE